MKNLAALIAGAIFGAGLVIGGMTEPTKVLAFLTLGPGWDPALMFVLGGALGVALLGYRMAGTRSAPLFDTEFHAPTTTRIDARLLSGSAIFGLGWGVSGFCPGPALVGFMTFDPRALVFLAAFGIGVLAHRFLVQDVPAVAPQASTDG